MRKGAAFLLVTMLIFSSFGIVLAQGPEVTSATIDPDMVEISNYNFTIKTEITWNDASSVTEVLLDDISLNWMIENVNDLYIDPTILLSDDPSPGETFELTIVFDLGAPAKLEIIIVAPKVWGDYIYTVTDGKATIAEYTGSGGAVEIPAKLGGFPVTAIGNESFWDKGLTSVIIPDSVTSIGYRAFAIPGPEGIGLTSVTLGNKVTYIGDGAFASNYLTSVTIPESVVTIGRNAFVANELTSIVFPKSVASIGQHAFVHNNLGSATFYNRMASIGEDVFGGNLGPVRIYGFSGSTAENYANEYEYVFIALPDVSRIFGSNRYTTAVEVSQAGWPDGADIVLLARGDNFPDSLAGVSLAYKLNAPILLTPTNSLHNATRQEIERLGANRVIILGGTVAVSASVEAELQAIDTVATVDRLGGENRYDTAKLIAGELNKVGSFDTAFIAYGLNFPDALAAASYGAAKGYPILLTGKDSLPAATRAALDSLSGIQKVVIVGGEAVISSGVATELASRGLNVRRIMGANRYETAVELAREYLPADVEEIFIATGLNFPDALAGGVLAAKRSSGVLLVQGDRASLPNSLESFMGERDITRAIILGGTSAVSERIEERLLELLTKAEPSYLSVSSTNPEGGSTGFPVSASGITITFDQNITSLDVTLISLTGPDGSVGIQVSFEPAPHNYLMYIQTVEPMAYDTEYTVVIGVDAVGGAEDTSVRLQAPYEFSFTTESVTSATINPDIVEISICNSSITTFITWNDAKSVEKILMEDGELNWDLQNDPELMIDPTVILNNGIVGDEFELTIVFDIGDPALLIVRIVEEVIIPMVLVGEPDEEYIIPTGINDDEEVYLLGGYMMATHQTTYELWYKVRIWAEENGYSFQLLGTEGSHGERGQETTVNMHEPVTDVTWRDAVVWLNALSEMTGLEPVYRIPGGIIKDSANESEIWILTGYSGYRLPTSMEWEMAARWKHDTTSTDGSILVDGRYWTPGTYASGATADYSDATATQLVAWYNLNSGGKTQPVGQLAPNHLGIYDMSGNVWEMTDTKSSWGLPSPLHEWVATDYPLLRGGAIDYHELYLQVGGGDAFNVSPLYAYGGGIAHPDSSLAAYYGFRVVRNP